MDAKSVLTAMTNGSRVALLAGAVLVFSGISEPSWGLILLGLAVLGVTAWRISRRLAPAELSPLPWPPELRARVEAMARPVDPTPKRIVPPDEKASMIAAVATTPEALKTLIADKPPAWPWAVFASVLVQRRNAVLPRLRAVACGYQPRAGLAPIDGLAYSRTVHQMMNQTLDWLAQLEQFIRSPGFTGAFGEPADDVEGDADAVVAAAERLMGFHERFLEQAEWALQTPVERDVLVMVADTTQFVLAPLASWETFIADMCARVGEAQELLPYTDKDTVIALDDAVLAFSLPDDVAERIVDHTKRFITPG